MNRLKKIPPEISVPEDIIRFSWKKKKIRIIVFCLIMVAVVLFLIFGRQYYEFWKPLNKILTLCATIVFVMIVTGVPLKLIDKSWWGTVEAVKINTYTDSEVKYRPLRENRFTSIRIILHVKTENSRNPVVVWQQPCRFLVPENYYKTGDTVCYIDGTDYVCRLPNKQGDTVKCVICGLENDRNNENCAVCGHGIIKMKKDKQDI